MILDYKCMGGFNDIEKIETKNVKKLNCVKFR